MRRRQGGGGKRGPVSADSRSGDRRRVLSSARFLFSARFRRALAPWLFLAPSLAGVAVFMGFPFLDAVSRSFRDAMGTRFVGLDNYRAVLDNSAFRLAAGNTVRFLAACMPLLLAGSLGLALLLSRRAQIYEKMPVKRGDTGGCRLIRTTLVLPMAVPAASMVLIWKVLLCPEGVLNQALSRATGTVWQVDWAFSSWAFPALAATYLWKHTGYDMILWLAGLQGISGDLYEAARIDGAGAWQELRYITLPQLKGTFCLVGILSLANSFRVYREAYLLAGSYPDSSVYLIPHLFAHWFLNLDVQKMTAAAVMMTGVFLAPVLLRSIWHRKNRRRRT